MTKVLSGYSLGTYRLQEEVCVNSVTTALNSGVRLIDTAHAYENETEVGEAIRNSGIPREEIFVITKLYPDQFSNPEAAIDEALTEQWSRRRVMVKSVPLDYQTGM